MSEFLLETYEWDNTWIEKSNDKTSKRVLYIGDSISCGNRSRLNQFAAGDILFDGFGTSKALDNPYFFSSLSLFAKQEPKRNAILFNNGLHGWHLDEESYKKLYADFLDKLIAEFPDSPIYCLLTTFVTNVYYHNDRVIIRNKIVEELAKERNLYFIDIYTVSENNKDLLSTDGVHFTPQGYDILANAILNELNNYL